MCNARFVKRTNSTVHFVVTRVAVARPIVPTPPRTVPKGPGLKLAPEIKANYSRRSILRPIDGAVGHANGQQPLPVDALVQQTAASGSAAPGVAAAGSAAADAQVPQSVVGLIHPEWAEPSVFCSTCGNMVSLSRTSILAKREGTWRCNKCRVKITALFRGFGTWPVHGFDTISEEEKRKFFADVQDKSGTECVAMARSLMCKYEEHHKFYEERGSFYPCPFGRRTDSRWTKSPATVLAATGRSIPSWANAFALP